jgi:hypothetical protein
VRRSLENSNSTNLLKFDDQVLKGFAITWNKQNVIHYIDFDKIGMFSLYFLAPIQVFSKGVSINLRNKN